MLVIFRIILMLLSWIVFCAWVSGGSMFSVRGNPNLIPFSLVGGCRVLIVFVCMGSSRKIEQIPLWGLWCCLRLLYWYGCLYNLCSLLCVVPGVFSSPWEGWKLLDEKWPHVERLVCGLLLVCFVFLGCQ